MKDRVGISFNFWWRVAVLACAWVMSSPAKAAPMAPTQTLATTEVQTKKAADFASGITATGYLDLRPSWTTKTGGVGTENAAEIGAKLSAHTTVTWIQAFNTNLYDPVSPQANSGLRFVLDVGGVRTKVNNIWTNESQGLALSYENRLYLPTDEPSRNNGLIANIRNYIKLSKIISSRVKLTLSDAVIPMVYSRSGNVSAKGVALANGVFENRIYLVTDIQFTDKLSLSIPVWLNQTRTANFRSDAANNSSWSFAVLTYPELDYALSDNLSLGLAYYNNESFFTPSLSKAQFGKSLESGEFQFVLTASF
jgi:hypothetical protein